MRTIQVTLHPRNRKVGVIKSFTGDKADKYVNRIRGQFKFLNPVKFHVKGKRRDSIPTYLHAISKDGNFRAGLLAEIYDFVKGDNKAFDFQVSEEFHRIYEPSFPLPEKYVLHDPTDFGFDEYRDVQEEAIRRIFKRGRGTIEVGTAGGKGLVMAGIIQTLHDYQPTYRFTVITPTHLVGKTVAEFRDNYGLTDITGWGDTLKPDFSKKILVAGPHALARAEDLSQIDRNVCLIDEVHIINNTSKIGKIVDANISTPNIIGLTGSLSDKDIDRWRCIGSVGKVVYKVTSEELKEKGYKARSRVVAVKFDNHLYSPAIPEPVLTAPEGVDVEDFTPDPTIYLQEREYLLKSDRRNRAIARLIAGACPKNTLVPIEFDAHQELLVPILEEETGRPVWVIDGSVPSPDRLKMYAKMEDVNDVILVVKVGCMKEGTSIKNLHYVAMPFIQKSFIRIIQLIGRAERLNDDKDEALIFDFHDDTRYSDKHFQERREIYERESIPILDKSMNFGSLKL